jgi:hypothetical protein
MYLGGSTLVGYMCWTGMEGMSDEVVRKKYGGEEGKQSYNEQAMMMEVLRGGGAADLAKVREQTNKRRMEIAEKNTSYASPPPSAVPSEKD